MADTTPDLGSMSDYPLGDPDLIAADTIANDYLTSDPDGVTLAQAYLRLKAQVDAVLAQHQRAPNGGPCGQCLVADGYDKCLTARTLASVVTPSRTDRQPPTSSSGAKGGLSAVAPDETNRPDLVTHHEET